MDDALCAGLLCVIEKGDLQGEVAALADASRLSGCRGSRISRSA
jgi:hypothetical protein